MNMKFKFSFAIFILFYTIAGYSQILEGKIIDEVSKTPLQGATVYFDGTTIVAITDSEGNFKINGRKSQSTMIVTYVGYVTYRMENPEQYENKKLRIQLTPEETTLEEVFIGKGPFTRKQMLAAFRMHFLGQSKSAQSCKIQNEDDLVLFFDVTNNTLSVTARNPIKVTNKHLQYELNFDLIDFNVQHKSKTLDLHFVVSNSFSGTTFFKDISGKEKINQKRLKVFLGSAPHLMHSIANETLDAEGFHIYVDSFRVNPKDYFQVSDTLTLKKIKLIKEIPQEQKTIVLKSKITANKNGTIKSSNFDKKFINILYKKELQSIMDFVEKEIIVDEDGNYAPIYGVLFGGYIGTLKAGDMLPKDFYKTVKSKPND